MADRVAGRLIWSTFTPLFRLLLAVYLGHWLWRWLALPRTWWVQHYLDDVLCIPLVLTPTLFILRFLYGAHIRLSFNQVLFTVAYFAIAFEVFFPQFMPRYTGDWIDVMLYALGGLLFYRYLNKPSC